MQANDFYGPATKMSANALWQVANQLGVEVEVLQAIVFKETRDQAFLPDGRPSILFEPHVFHHLTGGQFDQDYPDLSCANASQVTYGPGGWAQYEKLLRAMALDEKMALSSTSWGFWQCMGYNYRECGFLGVEEMVTAFVTGEPAQLQAFASFLNVRGFVPSLRTKDWATIAFKYNGPNYRQNHYDTDLADFYTKAKNAYVRIGSSGPQVTKVQQLLNLHGANLAVDGVFSSDDVDALQEFQEENGIAVDGVCGPQTLTALASARLRVTTPSQSKRVAGAVVAGGVGVGGAAPIVDLVKTTSEVAANVKASRDAEKAVKIANPTAATTPEAKILAHTSETASQSAEQAIAALHKAKIVIGFESTVLVLVAIYVAWTKFSDWKKQKGIQPWKH